MATTTTSTNTGGSSSGFVKTNPNQSFAPKKPEPIASKTTPDKGFVTPNTQQSTQPSKPTTPVGSGRTSGGSRRDTTEQTAEQPASQTKPISQSNYDVGYAYDVRTGEYYKTPYLNRYYATNDGRFGTSRIGQNPDYYKNQERTQLQRQLQAERTFLVEPLPASREYTPDVVKVKPTSNQDFAFSAEYVRDRVPQTGFEIAIERFQQTQKAFDESPQQVRARERMASTQRFANYLTGGYIGQNRDVAQRSFGGKLAVGFTEGVLLAFNPFATWDFGVTLGRQAVLSGQKAVLTGQGLVASPERTIEEQRRAGQVAIKTVTDAETIGMVAGGLIIGGISAGAKASVTRPNNVRNLPSVIESNIKIDIVRTKSITIPDEKVTTKFTTSEILADNKQYSASTVSRIVADINEQRLVSQYTSLRNAEGQIVGIQKGVGTMFDAPSGTITNIDFVSQTKPQNVLGKVITKQSQGRATIYGQEYSDSLRSQISIIGEQPSITKLKSFSAPADVFKLEFTSQKPLQDFRVLAGFESDIVTRPVEFNKVIDGVSIGIQKEGTFSRGSYRSYRGQDVNKFVKESGISPEFKIERPQFFSQERPTINAQRSNVGLASVEALSSQESLAMQFIRQNPMQSRSFTQTVVSKTQATFPTIVSLPKSILPMEPVIRLKDVAVTDMQTIAQQSEKQMLEQLYEPQLKPASTTDVLQISSPRQVSDVETIQRQFVAQESRTQLQTIQEFVNPPTPASFGGDFGILPPRYIPIPFDEPRLPNLQGRRKKGKPKKQKKKYTADITSFIFRDVYKAMKPPKGYRKSLGVVSGLGVRV